MRVMFTEVYESADESATSQGILHINDSNLVMKFDYDGKTYTYSGKDLGGGRWALFCKENGCKASLYRSVFGEDEFEGSLFFKDELSPSYRSMWRIEPSE